MIDQDAVPVHGPPPDEGPALSQRGAADATPASASLGAPYTPESDASASRALVVARDQLLEAPEAPVTPPPGEEPSGRAAELRRRWAVSVVAAAAGTWATVASSHWLGAFPTTTFAMAAIVASAAYGGFATGALTTLLCALGIDWYLTEPRQSLVMVRADEAIRIGLVAVVGLAVSALGGRVHRAGARLSALADALARRNVALDAQNRQAAAQEEARRAAVEAIDARARFFAMMSHELRTPINAIVGYVQLVELGVHGPVTQAQRTALARVQLASRHLLRLVNDVLDLARLEAGRFEYALDEVELREAVEAAAAMVEPQRRAKQQGLTIVIPETSCLVWADGHRLRQVLVNLLSNAVKFTPAGGRIAVRVALSDQVAPSAVVRVLDTGVGIPSGQLEAVFAPFVQLPTDRRSRQEGTGLGLAISRDLARGMGGELTVTSTVGAGSEFTLRLRRVASATGARTDRRFRDVGRAAGERRQPARR